MDKFILRAQMRAVLPEGMVLHASSVADDNGAFVFLAPSGGGKTTIMIKLSSDLFGAIAEDSVIIATGTDGVIRCLPCGSMKQDEGTDKIGGAPLKGFFFVEKGENAQCIKVTARYAFYRAMRSSSIMAYGHITPQEQKQARSYLERILRLYPSKIIRYSCDKHSASLLKSLLNE